MKKVKSVVLCAGLLLGAQTNAENLAYQFVCSDGSGGSSYTGFIDERINVRATFEQGKSGEQYHYCAADCRPHYGIWRCSFVTPSEERHWGPWVKHRRGLSCNEVCLEVHAVDGVLNRYISSSSIDITRYSAGIDDSFPIDWRLAGSHDGSDPPTTRRVHLNSDGQRLGYTFCWDEDNWGTNYWIAKYDETDPDNGGRMTEIILTDGDGRSHVFRVLGYFKETEAW